MVALLPRQLSGIPYRKAMSAEELLQELLCQRLEQDFQLLRPRTMSKLLTLRKEQTYAALRPPPCNHPLPRTLPRMYACVRLMIFHAC